MRAFAPIRLITAILILGIVLIPLPSLYAQDQNEPSLGDLARSLRKKPVVTETVIDNDNLPTVMDQAETQRMKGLSPTSLFSFAPVPNSIQISSPDVMCSLAFTGKNGSNDSDSLLAEDLPRSELAKLDGPATIDGDSLAVSVHNGSTWDVREVVIGLTIVRTANTGDSGARYREARIVPASSGVQRQAEPSMQKLPDVTMLLHVKGSALPSTTALFRTALSFALFPDQEWHWAIVRAKGIPLQAAPDGKALQLNSGVVQVPADVPLAERTAPLAIPAAAGPPAR